MAVLATLVLLCSMACGRRISENTHISFGSDANGFFEIERDEEIEIDSPRATGELPTGNFVELSLDGGDLQATQDELISGLDASVTSLTSPTAAEYMDTINFQEDTPTKQKEAAFESSITSSIESYAQQNPDDAILPVDDEAERSRLRPELDERPVSSSIKAALENSDEADLQDDAAPKASVAELLEAIATASEPQAVELQLDTKGTQREAAPDMEVSIAPLMSTLVEESSDHIDFQAETAAEQSNKNNNSSSSANQQTAASVPFSPKPGTGISSLMQEQASSPQKLSKWGNSFSTNINAFSWNYFSSVPSAVYVVFMVAFILTVISWFIGSFRFCWSRQLSCGLLKFESRQQHFHQDCMVYEWDQTLKSITIYLRPPEGQLANDLDIRISSRQLQVGRKGRHCFLKEETYDLVNVEMSSWTLDPNGELKIILRKARKKRWPVALLHNGKFLGGPLMQSDVLKPNLKPIEVM